ncbi:MAG TPA: MFS transporter [Rhizomicrobium sp.]
MDSLARAPYRASDFPLFLFCRFFTAVAMQVLSVAIGWRIYGITHSPLSLGLVGLCQFVPIFALTLPAGDLADRRDPRHVYAFCLAALAVSGALLCAITLAWSHRVWPYYAVLVAIGASRGIAGPSGQSLVPFLVPPERLTRAIAWSSSTFQVAVIVGPACGGLLYMLGPTAAFGTSAVCFLLAGVGVSRLAGRRRPGDKTPRANAAMRIAEGIAFVRHRPVILGALSLDLFAVLLGGATALLPAYARDILFAGPVGLGLLRSAPAFGAALMAISIGRQPIARRAGPKMFVAVAIFGIATIVFGLSRNLCLSLAALAVLGAADMISVYVRQSLVQLSVPDAMRGRVSAVNVLFIGASNELGEFESGVTASWFGIVPAVVIGGVGTLLVAALWTRLFPPLRGVDRLADIAG